MSGNENDIAAMQNPMTGAETKRKTAVIGVHGVGEHVPGATATAIVTQLLGGGFAYASFMASPLEIKVTTTGLLPSKAGFQASVLPAESAEKNADEIVDKPAGIFAGFNSVFHRRMVQADQRRSAAASAGIVRPLPPSVDLEFTQSLLEGGEAYTATYNTSFWRGDKTAHHTVDVFEMFWSDLSHGGGISALLMQFWQLLVHLASLGRTSAAIALNVKQAGGEDVRLWRLFYWLNAISYWLISMPIIVGNLWFLLAGGVFAVVMLQALPGLPIVTCILCGVAAACLAGSLQMRALARPGPRTSRAAFTTALVGIIAGGCAWWLAPYGSVPVAVIAIIPLYAIGKTLMQRYETVLPGAVLIWRYAAVVMAVLLLLALGYCTIFALPGIIRINEAGTLPPLAVIIFTTALYYIAQCLFGFLSVAWGALYVSNACLVIVGLIIKARTRDNSTRQTVYTCFAAGLIPAPLLLGIVLTFWAAFEIFFNKFLPNANILPITAFFAHTIDIHGDARYCAVLLTRMISNSAGPSFVPYVGMLLVALVLVLVGFLPSLLAELDPSPDAAAANKSTTLGSWLDSGFAALGWSFGLIIFGGAAVLPAGFFVLYVFFHGTPPAWLDDIDFVHVVGIAVSASTVSFLAATKIFSGSFAGTVTRCRVAIDTLLDVDNWLREHPEDATIRLKICARYVSLLRYIAAEKYTDIVIVAHSQGTVITADLLRHLTLTVTGMRDEAVLDCPVSLMTMGSPLRQLYNWRFPFLYAWAGDQTTTHGPAPAGLGVTAWVNAYGSGDYVGRALWQPATPFDDTVFTGSVAPASSEFCTGANAHTHYFDADNAKIARQIDELITKQYAR